MSNIRVLVVEDEAIASAAHAAYIGRLPGFELAGSAPDGQSALRLLGELSAAGNPVELVLLDMNLPDLHGLDIARRMRAAGILADIIAITAVRELAIVRSAVAIGVVQYLIKPFTFATFADKLESYRQFRQQLAGPDAGSGKPEHPKAKWTRPSQACGRRRNCPCPKASPHPRWARCRSLSGNTTSPCPPRKSWTPWACPVSPRAATSSTWRMPARSPGLPATAHRAGRKTSTAGAGADPAAGSSRR